MAFTYRQYAAFRAEFQRRAAMTTYERCNDRARRATIERRAIAIQRGNWWAHINWLDWLDEPSHEVRPTETVCMILMSREYRRTIEQLDRWWVVNTLKFAYDRAHELPLGALLNNRGMKLVFVEVGRKGSGKYRSVEVAA